MAISINVGAGAQALIGTSLKFTTERTPVPPTGFASVASFQVPGSPDQMRLLGTYRGPNTTIYARVKANYAGEGKAAIGTFPISLPVSNAQNGYDFQIDSAVGLVNNTSYTWVFYADNGSTQVPSGDAVEISGPIVIDAGSEPLPTLISPTSFEIPNGSVAGYVIGQLATDVVGAVFYEGNPPLALAEVDSDGTLTISAGQTASADGSFLFKAIATTSGPFASDISLNVAAAPPPPDPGTPDPYDPDEVYTGASAWATGIAQADAWLASDAAWNAALTAYGKSGTDDLVVGITYAHTGDLSMTNRVRRAGKGQVVFRGVGSFTPSGGASAARVTGQINVTGSSAIKLYLIEVVRSSNPVLFTGTDDLLMERMDFKGSLTFGIGQIPTGFCLHPQDGAAVNRVTIRNCSFIHYVNGIVFWVPTPQAKLIGNVFNWMSHDCIKLANSAGGDGMEIAWNNFSPTVIDAAGGNYHEDAVQITGTYTNIHFHHNFLAMRFWYFDSTIRSGIDANQMFWFGTGSAGCSGIVEQNFYCGSNGAIKGAPSAVISRQNTAIAVHGSPTSNQSISGTTSKNFTNTNNSGDKGAGVGGLAVNAGTTANGDVNLPYIAARGSVGSMIEVFEPDASSVLDPALGSAAIGCWELMDLIFNDGEHWEKWGYPTAHVFHGLLNANTALPTTYTGIYDGNGNNV